MNTNQNMRRVLLALGVTSALTAACGSKDDSGRGKSSGTDTLPASAATNDALAKRVGVDPGPVLQTAGAAAIVAATSGDVKVRRLGEESFADLKPDAPLYLGDQVRADEGASATLLFPDESTVELAELTTLSIGSRVTARDPASSAALLAGVARFSVTPRAPGEGPFLVFTPAGLVATKGTVFGVGVAADGDARVGVESGAVEVAGAVSLDAPITLEADAAAELAAAGTVAAPKPWPVDDWGAWRDQAEADLDVAATVALHADAMSALSAELEAGYAALGTLGEQVTSFEAEAAGFASANDTASYEARLPAAELAIDSSFLLGLRLEFLTHAYVSHAALAAELYVRHPELVALSTFEAGARAAVLWPKRFDATAAAYLEPLRIQYYLHHARGRAHAQFVGIGVPSFYARVTPPNPSANADVKLKFKLFTPPDVAFTASSRAVFVAAPSIDWHGKAKFKATAPRGKVAFCVRPPKLKSKAFLGAKVKGKIDAGFAVRPPVARAGIDAAWAADFGHKIKVAAPDLKGSAKARASWEAKAAIPDVRADLSARLEPKLKGEVRAGAKATAKIDAKAKGYARGAHDAKVKANGYVHGAHDAAAKVKAGANVKVKGPEIKMPTLKAEAKGSAKFKLGT